MPRPPKPYYWKARKEWYCTIDGVRHRLGPDKDAAETQFHELMASRRKSGNGIITVAELFERVLTFTRNNRSKRTDEWYEMFFQTFIDWLKAKYGKPTVERMPAVEVSGDDLQAWIDTRKDWGPSTKRGAVTAIKRAFNYGVKHGLIERNPVRAVEKPDGRNREILITQHEFDEILSHIPDEQFRDVLTVVWLTGCRPQEVVRVEARHVHDGCWLFPKNESKGKKRPRIVFLSDEAMSLTKKWAERNPTGPIFRNTKGRPWTAMAFNNRFAGLQLAAAKASGLDVTEHDIQKELCRIKKRRNEQGENAPKRTEKALLQEAKRAAQLRLARKSSPKICMYAIRHSYAHHGLTEGDIEPEVMAALLGHSDTTMIYKVYGHLLDNKDFMRKAAAKVRK